MKKMPKKYLVKLIILLFTLSSIYSVLIFCLYCKKLIPINIDNFTALDKIEMHIHHEAGYFAMDRDNYGEAIRDFTYIIENKNIYSATYGAALFNRGLCYYLDKNFQKAFNDFIAYNKLYYMTCACFCNSDSNKYCHDENERVTFIKCNIMSILSYIKLSDNIHYYKYYKSLPGYFIFLNYISNKYDKYNYILNLFLSIIDNDIKKLYDDNISFDEIQNKYFYGTFLILNNDYEKAMSYLNRITVNTIYYKLSNIEKEYYINSKMIPMQKNH